MHLAQSTSKKSIPKKSMKNSTKFLFVMLLIAQILGLAFSHAAHAEKNYTLIENVTYGKDLRQTLDIYVPKDLKEKVPVVIFFHGGSWSVGDKKEGQGFAETLVANGMIAVTPNYRLYPNPKNTFPYFMGDATQVAKWVKENTQSLNGDPNSIYFSGFSAGAYIAVMLATNEGYLKMVGLSFKDFAGTIASAGTYNFFPIPAEPYISIFEGNEWAAELNNVVRGDNQPMLFLASKSDEVVGIKNATSLVNKIQQLGGNAQLVTFENLNHHQMSTHPKLVNPILNFIWSNKPVK